MSSYFNFANSTQANHRLQGAEDYLNSFSHIQMQIYCLSCKFRYESYKAMKIFKSKLLQITCDVIGSSSVARGGCNGAFAPTKPRLLSTRENGVLAFYKQKFNINKAFKPKLSNCTPQAKFLATPLIGSRYTLNTFPY